MLLNPTEVAARLTVTRATVYVIMKRDPSFPRPVHVTPKNPRWDSDELDAWLKSKRAA